MADGQVGLWLVGSDFIVRGTYWRRATAGSCDSKQSQASKQARFTFWQAPAKCSRAHLPNGYIHGFGTCSLCTPKLLVKVLRRMCICPENAHPPQEPENEWDEPRVSPYRLAAHLVSAFTIYSTLVWTSLDLAYPRAMLASAGEAAQHAARRIRSRVLPFSALVAVTATSGAFVAGKSPGLVVGDCIFIGFLPSPGRQTDGRCRTRMNLAVRPDSLTENIQAQHVCGGFYGEKGSLVKRAD